MATQDSRILIKRSTVAGVVPTVPSSNDHTDGTWLATDIYKGELYYNQADNILYTRSDAGIKVVSGNDCVCIKEASLTIASADVKSAHASPVAFGLSVASGKAVKIAAASGSMTYGGTPYATNGVAVIRCVGANSGQVGFTANGFLFGTVTRTVPATYITSDGTTDTFLIDGADIEFYVDTGNPTDGNSDIVLKVLYYEIDI